MRLCSVLLSRSAPGPSGSPGVAGFGLENNAARGWSRWLQPEFTDRESSRGSSALVGSPFGHCLAYTFKSTERVMDQMRRQIRIAALILAFGPILGCEAPKADVKLPEPPKVNVSSAVSDEITDHEDFIGRTDAVYNIDVRARVTGYLDKVYFQDGTEVKEGDLLFEIDPRPYQAELNRAEATVLQSEARQNRLDADHRRATSLFNRGALSREEFDKVSGDFAEADAAVGIARANRDLAQLNLGYTKVTAPISGRLSRRVVDPGNLVKADETVLTNIVSLDPV